MRPATLAALAAALLLPATADARVPTPKKAKRMTWQLAYRATDNRMWDEWEDTVKWPRGVNWFIEWPCTNYGAGTNTPNRWRASCDYKLEGDLLDETGYPLLTKICTGTVTVRINRRSHRVSDTKHEDSCQTGYGTGPNFTPLP